ncbi:MAG: hypothetical protein K9N21_01790 [Deltaproteobacteria bacterium]|nr:hypothetical protein [Deltaproteobacteria bacterium]
MVTLFMRLTATGEADLVQETLDFRLTPKGVATLTGKGDTRDRTGIVEDPSSSAEKVKDPIKKLPLGPCPA